MLFLIAYNEIKKNATAGLDSIRGKNVISNSLYTFSKELYSEEYKSVSVRRLYIDKPQGGKRPWNTKYA